MRKTQVPATANAGDVVVVDASASTDADNDTLTYTWQLPAGLVAQTNGAQVTFTAAEYTERLLLRKKWITAAHVAMHGMRARFTQVANK